MSRRACCRAVLACVGVVFHKLVVLHAIISQSLVFSQAPFVRRIVILFTWSFAGLALPVCENLATALFIKGLQGQGTEGEAWNVLEYIRQRGMVHRPEVRVWLGLCTCSLSDLHTAFMLMLPHTPTGRPEQGGRSQQSGYHLPRVVPCLLRLKAHPTRETRVWSRCRPAKCFFRSPPQQPQQ